MTFGSPPIYPMFLKSNHHYDHHDYIHPFGPHHFFCSYQNVPV